MRVRVLGDFEVHRDGRGVDLGGPQQRALVALLVSAAGRAVPAERLIDQLWGEDPPPGALGSLQAKIAKLRRRLEPDRDARAEPTVLVTRPSGYALVLAPEAVDADRFAAAVARARDAGDPVATERLLAEALDLWSGAAYGGVAPLSPALRSEAARLEELRLSATEQLWAARIERGDHDRAAAELRQLASDHPVRERLWGLLALALYRSERQAEALAALREVRRHLAEELGLDPGEELRALEEAMLRQDPELLPRAAASPVPVAAPDQVSLTAVTLPGREEWLRLAEQAVAEAASGRGQVVLVTGQPGIGKTRLAQAVVDQATAAGLRSGWGTWEADGCPTLWGWREALAPVLGDRSPVGGRPEAGASERDAASATFELAEEVAVAIRETGGSCLVLDDVHWADADSHRLLRRIAAVVGELPVLLLVLSRDTDDEVGDVLTQTFATLSRLGALRMPLEGLSAEAVAAHVHRATGVQIDERIAERLRDRTDGNAFYVQEMVRALAGTPAFHDLDDPLWGTVPVGVRDVVRHRLHALPPSVAQVLSDAAVLGRTFDFDVLEEAWAGDPETLDSALASALAAGLLVEDAPAHYRFRHVLARDAVHDDLPAPTRPRVHARVAQALERRRVGRLDAHAAQLAEHYRLAGPAHVRSAWTYAARAAELAAREAAYDEASRLLHSAVELQVDDPLTSDLEREQLMVAHGRALHQVGRIYDAWEPLARAAQSALARGDARSAAEALLVITRGAVWSWRLPPVVEHDAIALWKGVLEGLPAEETGLRVRCQAALAVEWLYAPRSGDRAAAMVDEALDVARRQGDPVLLIEVLNLTHMALHRPHQRLRRVPVADEMVVLCTRRGDERGLAAALSRRAPDRAELGRWADAVADLHRAREIARRHHLAPALMITGYGLVLDRIAVGDWDGALEVIAANDEFEATMSMAGTGIGLAQRATALLMQGRLGDLEPEIRTAVGWHPTLRDLHAFALVSSGRTEEARAALGPWEGQPDYSFDYLWISSMVLRAWVWCGLGDRTAAADLREQLTPYADRLAVGGLSAYLLGSVHHTLALLAEVLGERAEAEAEAREALAVHRRLGFGPWTERSERLLERLGAGARQEDGKGAASRS